MENFYKLSGRSGVLGVINAIVTVLLLSIIIAFLQIYIRNVIYYFIEFFIIYFVYIIYACTLYEGKEKKGHNRNRKLSFIGTTIAATIVIYTLWCANIVINKRVPFFDVFSDPKSVGLYISKNFYFEDVYPILEVLWVYFAFYSIAMLSKYDVYCESCYTWLEKEPLPMTIDATIAKDIKKDMLTGSLRWVDDVRVSKSKPYIQIYITYCGGCDGLNLISAEHSYVKKTSDGTENATEFLFQNLMLSKEKFNKLLEQLGENVNKV
ncbi:hypothetical protein [Candidatus Uabimicrobium sp. HlEnr_7]|uniref:hypothetical protein n=1 Tax=Candidatus Uabimicrobium helgolandensis TaxID=3095367 RepID=UPI003558836D